MRTCTQCNERPSIEECKRPICRPCKKEYERLWWQENKSEKLARKLERNKENKQRNQQFVAEYLKDHPCSCGESDPIVLTFDHLQDKEFDICTGVCRGYSLERIQKEIQKCQVLCANCHTRKTAQDYGYWKSQLVQDPGWVASFGN